MAGGPMTELHSNENLQLMTALAEARRAAGMSQRDLAKRLGCDQSYITKYENAGRRLDVIEFLKIVRAIGADYRTLLDAVKLKG